MKLVIPGGSGQVGTMLARAFHASGMDVVVLSRQPRRQPWRVIFWDGVSCDGERPGSWQHEVDGADAVVNLAGRSVNCRYDAATRRAILHSRIASVRAVGDAIRRARRPPRVWLQASTATIYAHRYDAANDERTGVLGGGEPHAPDTWRFSIDVARAWEQAFDETTAGTTRMVALRSAMTMSPDAGGVFDAFASLVRRGLGGSQGDGRQFVSWIHERDFIAALRWLIDREDITGAVNIASPNPLPNAAFMRTLRHELGVPFGLPARGWMLEVGAMVMRTETELVLKSRRVVPARLLDSGFRFSYPDWPEAARELAGRWKRRRHGVPSAA